MISIALATYNGEKFLGEQLRSLRDQTILPAELVVCDDGSTDRTSEILADFAAGAPFPVRLTVNEERLGYRANFLKAASLCNSDFVAFCDQDDVWDREKLEVITTAISASDCALLQHGFRLINAQGEEISADISKFSNEEPHWASSYGLTQVFHRSLLTYFPLWEYSVDHTQAEEKMSHDQWISFLAAVIGSVITVDQSLLSYRQHDTNTFGFKKPDDAEPPLKSNLIILFRRWYGNGYAFRQKSRYLERRIERMISGASSRICVLEKLLAYDQGLPRGRIAENINYYISFRNYYAKRLSIYSAERAFPKIHGFVALCSSLTYAKWGSRGYRDCILDCFYGIMR